jgi:nucleotide-binding universal stress UspA family protein
MYRLFGRQPVMLMLSKWVCSLLGLTTNRFAQAVNQLETAHAALQGTLERTFSKEAVMKSILVPLDGSPLAEQAIANAIMLAQTMKLPLVFFRVVPDLDHESLLVSSLSAMSAGYSGEAASVSHAYNQQITQALREQAEAYLDEEANTARINGIDITTVVQAGIPAELILEYATHNDVAMIVMATHGYSGIRRWAIGSVADKVVHKATMPVLLIRGSVVPAKPVQLKQLLVPLDGSTVSEQALPQAIALAQAAGAQITLLHVLDPLVEASAGVRPFGLNMTHPDWVLDDALDRVNTHLGDIAAGVASEDLKVDTLAVVGYPAEAIVDEAKRTHSDLIVMATHGYSGIRRWALGSTADKVLHETGTPLLLIRATETE